MESRTVLLDDATSQKVFAIIGEKDSEWEKSEAIRLACEDYLAVECTLSSVPLDGTKDRFEVYPIGTEMAYRFRFKKVDMF